MKKTKKQLQVRIETINSLLATFGDEHGKLAKELNEAHKELREMKEMKKMKEIIDTWNIIEKYDVKGWKEEKGIIYIPKEEFERVYEEILNKSYLINLIKYKNKGERRND